jgi:hypothetical protein
MQININCKQYAGYSTARIELDGTVNLAEPVECNYHEPLGAIAIAILQYLMTTGQLKVVLNGKEVITQVNDETPFQDFFEDCEWLHDHDVMTRI